MNRSAFKFPLPDEPFEWTGERYVSGLGGQIQHEHYHRYLFSLAYCHGKAVLDIACGEGYGSYLLGQVAASVIGVDIDRRVIRWANSQYLSERVSFREGDAVCLPIDDQSIDVVTSFETVEHITGQEKFIEEVARVLRPGGLFIVSSPNRPVYSDETGEVNPFHVHELDEGEFLALLAPRFPHVKLFEQQAITGSVIIGTGKTGAGPVERFDSPDGTQVERFADQTRAMYFVAIASQEPLAATSSSVFHSASFHLNEVAERERRIRELEQAQAEAQRVVDERGERIAELERARAEAQRVVDERGTQLQVEAERFAELERSQAGRLAELERACAEAQRVVDERGEKIGQLAAQLNSAEEGHAELTRALTALTVRLDTVQSVLSEREAAFASVVSERDAMAASTLWQLTRPLRMAGRLVPLRIRGVIRRCIRALWRTVSLRIFYKTSPAKSA